MRFNKTKSNIDIDIDIEYLKNNKKPYTFSSILRSVSSESDINNLIVVGTLKVDE